MKLIDKVKKNLEDYLTKFLILKMKESSKVSIQEYMSFTDNVIFNKILFRGQPKELIQLYSYLDMDDTAFWKQSSTSKDMRKIHCGLPNILCKSISNLVVSDFIGIDIDNDEYKKLWEEIEQDNNFYKSFQKILNKVLSEGDGCIKIIYNPNISDYPILHYVEALNVNYKYEYDRLKEVIFRTDYKLDNKNYHLLEYYGKGYIRYKLYDEDKNEFPLNTIEDLKDLKDIEFLNEEGKLDNDIILAVPIKIFESSLFIDRGESIFNGRQQKFDFADQCYSELSQHLKTNRSRCYMPSSFIPKDEQGNLLDTNSYTNNYIMLDTSRVMNGNNPLKVEVESPNLQVDAYVSAFYQAVSDCLLGLVSPATLGFDVKKMDNAEAEREKQGQTIATRATIVSEFSDCLEKIVFYSLKSFYVMNNMFFDDRFEIGVNFGEYVQSSTEKRISTMKEALPGKCLISYELMVDELWGDSLTEDEKLEEINRLKALNDGGSVELNDLYNEDGEDTQIEEPIEEDIQNEDIEKEEE